MRSRNRWRIIFAACAFLAASAASAQTFTTLAYFTDGSNVFSSLLQGTDGNLYGTSNNGGTNGLGSVFRISPDGALTTLYSFCSESNCMDGFFPFGALALGKDGNFYGTTQNGGSGGLGTVFKITPTGVLTVIHSFNGSDGSGPEAGLALGTDGNLYGTTGSGGAINGCLGQCGTVFKITPSGALTTMHSFDGNDGALPSAALIQGIDGNFYGTTDSGGTGNCNGGSCGTVFKITPAGIFTSLHSFDFTDGERPVAPLMQASNGAYYGTTSEGGDAGSKGCSGGCGTIFKISSGGTFATVHKFFFSDGGALQSGLVQATDGSLYGESPEGGTGYGKIFSLTLPRTLTTVYSFSSSSQGGGGTAVVQLTDGNLYGTYGVPGAVFRLDMSLAPFIAFVLPTGKVGQTAQILGQGLTGSTVITFNGIPATTFSVVSDTYMTAVVPAGASTGPVVVSTPTGTLTSNKNFRISK